MVFELTVLIAAIAAEMNVKLVRVEAQPETLRSGLDPYENSGNVVRVWILQGFFNIYLSAVLFLSTQASDICAKEGSFEIC